MPAAASRVCSISSPENLFVDARELIARAGLSDDQALADVLLDRARVGVVPGTAFGAPGYLRLSYATARSELGRAVDRIADFAAGV